MKLKFAGLRAGGGKTYALINIASLRYENGEKTIIVAPTTKLIDELVKDIGELYPSIRPHVFYKREDRDESVVVQVIEHLRNYHVPGDIVIVTHSCFFRLPFFPNKILWNVFIDEAPSIYEVLKLSLPDNHELITDLIGFTEAGSEFGLIKPIDETAVKSIADNKLGDAVNDILKPIAKVLCDSRFINYASVDAFTGLKAGNKDATELTIHSLMKPKILDGFESVTIAAAGFEKTLTFHHWRNAGVEWSEDVALKKKLRRPAHPANPTVKIYYGYEKPNSKYLRDEMIRKEDDSLRSAVKKLMDQKPFVYLENKDYLDRTSLKGHGAGKPLPSMSHGLNDFRTFHNAAILSAYNHDPQSRLFLRMVCGFDDDLQSEASFLNIYQAVMRTSLRNDDAVNEKAFVLTSKLDADRLHEWLPGSTVHSLDLQQPVTKQRGAPKRNGSDYDRRRAHQERRKNDSLLRSGFAGNLTNELLNQLPTWKKLDTNTITISDYVRDFQDSFFNNYKDLIPKSIVMHEDKWIKSMKEMHNKSYRQKHDIPMVSGALFIPTGNADKSRDTNNVQIVKDIWIDIEDGDMSIDQFASAFPLVKFIAYNTLNHTKSKPRFRIKIPTSRYMSVLEFRSIYHEIRHTLKRRGYAGGKRSNYTGDNPSNRPFDGIDSRPNPSSLSGLPCQPISGKDAFFIEFTNGRKDLNVGYWGKQSSYLGGDDEFFDLPAIPTGADHSELTTEQLAAIADAEREWVLYGRKRGAGDQGIFELYRSLRQGRVPYFILEQRLYQAAGNASSPSERRTQVKRLLENCRRCQ